MFREKQSQTNPVTTGLVAMHVVIGLMLLGGVKTGLHPGTALGLFGLCVLATMLMRKKGILQ